MEQNLLKIVAALFSLFALSRVYLRFKERKLSYFGFSFWVFVWLAGLTIVFFPGLSSSFATFVGIGRGVDVILYASVIILFYLIFRIYIKMEDIQKQITTLTRSIALDQKSRK